MEIAGVCSLAGFVKVTNALWCCFPTWLHKFGFGCSRRKMTGNSMGYFWFEALILNRTVPFFYPQIQDVLRFPAGYLERDDLWCMWEVQPQREWERAPVPAASFPSKCSIVGIGGLIGACLIHPCCPRIDPLPILYLRETCLRDLSGYQCSKHCDIYCQSSPVFSTLERFS